MFEPAWLPLDNTAESSLGSNQVLDCGCFVYSRTIYFTSEYDTKFIQELFCPYEEW